MGNVLQILAVNGQVLFEVFQASDIIVPHFLLAVADEYYPVNVLKHGFSCLVVEHLSRNRKYMESRSVSFYVAQLDGQEVEEQCAVAGAQVDQFAPVIGAHFVVDIFDIGRLAGQSRSVIDDFGFYFFLSPTYSCFFPTGKK